MSPTPPRRRRTPAESAADTPRAAGLAVARPVALPGARGRTVAPVEIEPRRPTRLEVKRGQRRHRTALLRRTLAALVAVAVFVVTGAMWSATQYLDSKVRNVEALDEGSASVQDADGQRGDENYLLVGSDSRAGTNGEIGAGTTAQAEGARSDTVMLAHVPADRGRVVVVSFPRDLEIDRPACAEWDNPSASYTSTVAEPEKRAKLNSAYATGGPKCLVQVIQQISGLKINHFVGIDFSGFSALVDQIGGVEVCATRPLVDGELGTILPTAGTSTIDGTTALNYVRARKVDSETNGDYGRITRQQRFLSSLLRKSMSTDVLLDLRKLNGFINGFTAATFGENMNSDSLLTLGQSLQGLSAGRVTFLTVPTNGTRYGNEVPNLPEITSIFRAVINGTPLPGEQGAPTTPAPTTPPEVPKPGGSAQLTLRNATNTAGLATSTGRQLTDLGYTVARIDSAEGVRASTVIRYSAEQAAAAEQLATSIPGSQLQLVAGLGATVDVVLGNSFDGSVVPPSGPEGVGTKPLPSDLAVVNAGDVSCT